MYKVLVTVRLAQKAVIPTALLLLAYDLFTRSSEAKSDNSACSVLLWISWCRNRVHVSHSGEARLYYLIPALMGRLDFITSPIVFLRKADYGQHVIINGRLDSITGPMFVSGK